MAVGKFGPASALILVDGYDLTASKPGTMDVSDEAVTIETTGLGDSFREHTPTGLRQVEMSLAGALFDTTANRSHDAFSSFVPSTPQATARVICLGFAGQTIGSPFVGMQGAWTMDYKVLVEQNDLQRVNADYQITGQKDDGIILQELEAKTADWNTEAAESFDSVDDPKRLTIPVTSNSQANPTVVTTPIAHGLTTGDIIVISGVAGSSPDINGERTVTVITTTTFSVPIDTSLGTGGTGGTFRRADSQDGGVGYLQVTAASGFTNFVAKIRDSLDDVTFADLITFADNVVAPFAERVTVAGEVDRYLGVDGNVTGIGSITAFVGFARN